MLDERDEDDLLDEKAAAMDKAIENGEPIDWNDNDRAFMALGEDDDDEGEPSDDGETDAFDDDDDGAADDDRLSGDDDDDADADGDMSDEDREALEDYIPPDITTNNPIPYKER
jgi:hypothetical protein